MRMILPLVALVWTAPVLASEADFGELMAADARFAAAADGKDLVTAVSAMFDRDVALVAAGGPGFAKGKAAAVERLRGKPENLTSRVSWRPLGGGVSTDGTHGYTYGGMTITPQGKPPQPIKYLAYWVKRPEGWRVAAYTRRLAPSTDQLKPAPPVIGEARHPGTPASAVAAAERAFSDEAQQIGLRAAFAKWGRPDSVMTATGGAEFSIGAAQIAERAAGPEPTSSVEWSADEALVAPSGDMGVSIGHIRLKATPPEGAPQSFPFFTVWARPKPGDPWRYVAE